MFNTHNSLGRYLEGLLPQLCYALADFYNLLTRGGLEFKPARRHFISIATTNNR